MHTRSVRTAGALGSDWIRVPYKYTPGALGWDWIKVCDKYVPVLWAEAESQYLSNSAWCSGLRLNQGTSQICAWCSGLRLSQGAS